MYDYMGGGVWGVCGCEMGCAGVCVIPESVFLCDLGVYDANVLDMVCLHVILNNNKNNIWNCSSFYSPFTSLWDKAIRTQFAHVLFTCGMLIWVCIYEELVSKTSYIHPDMLLICIIDFLLQLK